MRISDWSSDVCSSDLLLHDGEPVALFADSRLQPAQRAHRRTSFGWSAGPAVVGPQPLRQGLFPEPRSEEHTSELQSLMRISYAVFCLKKHKNNNIYHTKDDSYARNHYEHKKKK